MKKIKVLHITQSVIGGTLEYIKLFFMNIDRKKFELELVCPSYGPMKKQIEYLGFKVHVIDMKREINLINDFKAYLKLKSLIMEIKPDIIHIHSSKAGVIGRRAAYKCKVPNIYNPHGWSFSMDVSKRKKRFYAFVERYCTKYCNYIINISDSEQELAFKYNISSCNKMKVIYNGIDIKKYNIAYDRKKVLDELGIPQNSFVIGMVGRITRQKSPETFIQIASKLQKEIKNVYFILVGDGELKSDIDKLSNILKVKDKVRITGWTNNVGKYISVFDIAILTSKWEGFGLAITEYMAARKPVVASNVGGIANIIKDSYNGFLVNPNIIEEFSKKILQIYNNNQLKNKIIENAYNDVCNKFDIKRVVKQHEEIYMNIVN